MLTARKETVLKAVVQGYIDTAAPVGSRSISRGQGISVSPATIRMEMADLEEEGFITRPHTSAGGVPTDKGYRHYVERLLDTKDLAPREKSILRQHFSQAYLDQEALARMAITVLPKMTRNLALITAPKALQVRLKRLELVPVQDLLILLLIILQGTKIVRRLVSLDEPIPSQELARISNKLSELFGGVASPEITEVEAELTPLETEVLALTRELMETEEQQSYEEPLFEGFQELFHQPEFSQIEILRDVLEVLKQEGFLRGVVEEIYSGPGVQVAIGGELREASMRHFSLVIAEYGVTSVARGMVGVLGPKRMDYSKNMATIHYLAQLMSQIVGETYR